MSDEIVPYADSPLARFAADASQVHRVATVLASSAFVPAQFRGKPEEVTAAIMAGNEVGLTPMTALRAMHVIEGKPSLEANAQRGLAMAAGVAFEVLEASDHKVRMRAKAPGGAWHESEWDMDRARKMGLATKSNWQKMPRSMMLARCTSELCRLVAANVLMGLPYSVEELRDELPEETPPPVMAAAPRKRMQRAPMPEPELELPRQPEVPAIEAAPPEPEPEPEPQFLSEPEPEAPELKEKITDNTRKAIMAGFNDLNIKDRNERLRRVSQVVEYDVPSVNVLTEHEGRTVVDYLYGEREAIRANSAYPSLETGVAR